LGRAIRKKLSKQRGPSLRLRHAIRAQILKSSRQSVVVHGAEAGLLQTNDRGLTAKSIFGDPLERLTAATICVQMAVMNDHGRLLDPSAFGLMAMTEVVIPFATY
jgi:hypothetical protein